MRKLIVLFAALVLLPALLLLLTHLSHAGKVKIMLSVAPSGSLVTVDSKDISGDTIYISKGRHVFEATFRDFTPDRRTVNIQRPATLILYPRPESASALQFLAENPRIQQEREAIIGPTSTAANQTASRQYPYLSELPIETEAFSIYPGAPERSKNSGNGTVVMALHVYANTPQDRIAAVNRIRTGLGIDPSSVEIIFEDMTNIFLTGVY
jgi:hypothetical protein